MRFDQTYGNKNQTTTTTPSRSDSEILESRRKVAFERDLAHKRGKLACPYCDFTGMANAVELSSKTMFAFRCTHCTSAERLNIGPGFPGWTDDLKDRFRLMRSDETLNTEEILGKQGGGYWQDPENVAPIPTPDTPNFEQNHIPDPSELPF